MSASIANTGINLNDTAKQVKEKINKYALSGGQQTAEEQRKLGANLDIDVPYKYLEFFLEDDDKLAEIKDKYSKGELLTGEVKKVLIECLQEFLKEFQERRAKVTDADVEKFMAQRKINMFPKAW